MRIRACAQIFFSSLYIALAFDYLHIYYNTIAKVSGTDVHIQDAQKWGYHQPCALCEVRTWHGEYSSDPEQQTATDSFGTYVCSYKLRYCAYIPPEYQGVTNKQFLVNWLGIDPCGGGKGERCEGMPGLPVNWEIKPRPQRMSVKTTAVHKVVQTTPPSSQLLRWDSSIKKTVLVARIHI